jgi:predicted aspartyl protease
MSLLIVDDNDVTDGDLLLHSEDYPSTFRNMKHEDDEVIADSAIVPDFIRHRRPHHHRLLLRVSFKLTNGRFVPFTFVCDTGAPSSFYLSPSADQILGDGGRRLEDDAGNTYMVIMGHRAATKETPSTHQPGNIIGLTMLEKLGLLVDTTGFSFQEKFDYF